MRIRFLIPFLIPTIALAQSNAPLLVVGGEQPPAAVAPSEQAQRDLLELFPAHAITAIGANTTGQNHDIPAAPAAPAAPTAPSSAMVPAAPAAASIPKPPANPLDKLWPIDTVPLFMQSCVGIQPKLLGPCRCVITKLMVTMPHDEFLQLSAAGTIEQDARLIKARQDCVTAPTRRGQ